MNTTPIYKLPQFVEQDLYSEEDFNSAFQKIESSLSSNKSMCENAVSSVNTLINQQSEEVEGQIGTLTQDVNTKVLGMKEEVNRITDENVLINKRMDEIVSSDTNAEVISARTDTKNVTHKNIGKRLDNIETIKANKTDIPTLPTNIALKDGTLQTGLNSEKLGGKLISDLSIKDGTLQVGLNAEKLGNLNLNEVVTYWQRNEIPIEISECIDFHKRGTATDCSLRLYFEPSTNELYRDNTVNIKRLLTYEDYEKMNYPIDNNFGENSNIITTDQFLTLLESKKAFTGVMWTTRATWSYGSNQRIDTPCGIIHLAGATIQVIGTRRDLCTIKIITCPTGDGIRNGEFVYINNGSEYSPSWRRSLSKYSYGTALPSSGEEGEVFFLLK